MAALFDRNGEKAALRKYWARSFEQAVEQDGWGQVIEAVETYERLANDIELKISGTDCHEHDKVRQLLMSPLPFTNIAL